MGSSKLLLYVRKSSFPTAVLAVAYLTSILGLSVKLVESEHPRNVWRPTVKIDLRQNTDPAKRCLEMWKAGHTRIIFMLFFVGFLKVSAPLSFSFSLFWSPLFNPHLPPFHNINRLSVYQKDQSCLSFLLLLPQFRIPPHCFYFLSKPQWVLLFFPQVTCSPVPRSHSFHRLLQFTTTSSHLDILFLVSLLSIDDEMTYILGFIQICLHKQNTLHLEIQVWHFFGFHCETFSKRSHLLILSLFLYLLIPFQTHDK